MKTLGGRTLKGRQQGRLPRPGTTYTGSVWVRLLETSTGDPFATVFLWPG